jgi:regulator of sigma D
MTIWEFAQAKFQEKGEKLILPAKYVNERLKEYGILIVDQAGFMKCVRQLKDKSKEQILPKLMAITRNIMKYSDEELNEHYKANNQEFKDWGDDIILFYIHRAAMDDKWAEKNPILVY